MEEGRLYSRISGWENGIPVKYYYTKIINIFPKDILNIDGKSGSFIYNFLENNNLIQIYPDAYYISKTFPSWIFYYGQSKIITSLEN